MKIAAAVLFLCLAVAARAATVTVFAAASLTDCMREIARQYETQRGGKVEFNFAASSVLERQIEAGAPADIFFSADEAKMDALGKKGLIDTKSRHPRLSNSLALVVARGNPAAVHSPDDLTKDSVRRIALAETQSVPAGIYARAYLTKIGLWKKIASKVVPLQNVRAALAAVESGDAEAGFVYKTDAAISSRVETAYEVPPKEGPKITYPVALVKDAPEPQAARDFLRYIDSPEAARVFTRFGFLIDSHDGR